MALPKRRKSKSKTRIKKSMNSAMSSVVMVQCSNKDCMEYIPSHWVCPYCGHYDGKQVVEIKKEK